MENSSMLVLPRMTAPAARSRVVIVASYGGCQPLRIFDPAVVGMSVVVNTSFSATGTPASGPSSSPAERRSSTLRAAASAPLVATCRKACTWSSAPAIRSRWAWVTSVAETFLARSSPESSAAVIRVRSSLIGQFLIQNPGHLEPLLFHRGRLGEHHVGRQAGARLVLAVDVGQRQGVRGRRDPLGRDL